MTPLKPETIEKLEWLKGRLRKYPHRYDQLEWCGTQGCLAGFCLPKALGVRSVILSKKQSEEVEGGFDETAGNFLGITRDMSRRLFSAWWRFDAQQFNRADADTDEQATEKACQRIDLFIQSGGTK